MDCAAAADDVRLTTSLTLLRVKKPLMEDLTYKAA